MHSIRQNVRKWWQPPRRLADRESNRTVTFLELFYDLVYVVLIAQLAHALSEDVSWAGIGRFAFLFVILWWAWFNGSSYHDLHGNDDIRTRVFTFLQMFTVAAMAVFAHDAMGDSSTGFALSYAAFQIILTWLWWRTGVYDPAHRPLSQPYVAVYLLTAVVFIGSVFISAPLRFYLWGGTLLISILLPITTTIRGRNNPEIQAQINMAVAVSPSVIERFGLLTIIVLGEVIVGTVSGVAERLHLSWEVGATAVLGMLIAIGIWWIYFDIIAHHHPRPSRQHVLAWFYLHLPLTAGISAVGAAVLNVVEHAGEQFPVEVRWLLVGAVALVLAAITLLTYVIQVPQSHQRVYHVGKRLTLVAAILIALLGFTRLGIISLLVLLIAMLLAPIFYSFVVWVEILSIEEG